MYYTQKVDFKLLVYYELTIEDEDKISYLAGLQYLKQQLEAELSGVAMVVSEQAGQYMATGEDFEQDIHLFLR